MKVKLFFMRARVGAVEGQTSPGLLRAPERSEELQGGGPCSRNRPALSSAAEAHHGRSACRCLAEAGSITTSPCQLKTFWARARVWGRARV